MTTQLRELLNDPIMDDSERMRADWMWRRRPKSAFGEEFLHYCLVFAAGISLPLIHGIGRFLDVAWLFTSSLLIASDKVRAIRWRRDYEASLCRLIRGVGRRKTIQPAKSEIKMDTEMNNLGIMPRSENKTAGSFASNALPARKGSRPKTIIGPLHIQCNGHGDPKYLKQLVDDVLTWPYIESAPSLVRLPDTIPILLEDKATTSNSSAFISAREFARVLLGAPTICMALPLECAHWAIVRGGPSHITFAPSG